MKPLANSSLYPSLAAIYSLIWHVSNISSIFLRTTKCSGTFILVRSADPRNGCLKDMWCTEKYIKPHSAYHGIYRTFPLLATAILCHRARNLAATKTSGLRNHFTTSRRGDINMVRTEQVHGMSSMRRANMKPCVHSSLSNLVALRCASSLAQQSLKLWRKWGRVYFGAPDGEGM